MGASILPSGRAGRSGTALVTPCFHAKFPVVCGAEGSKGRSHPRNTCNRRGECSKEQGLDKILFKITFFLHCSSLRVRLNTV